MIFLLWDQETSYCIYNTYILRSESLEARPYWSWLGLASGHFILVSETGSSVHSKMGSLFFFFFLFSAFWHLARGHIQTGITSNGSFGEGTWTQKSPGRKKQKTTYKANDGNLSLAVLGEIISFVTLFFSFFFFPFFLLFHLFSPISPGPAHSAWAMCLTIWTFGFPFVYSLFTSLLVTSFFTFSSIVSFILVSVYSM